MKDMIKDCEINIEDRDAVLLLLALTGKPIYRRDVMIMELFILQKEILGKCTSCGAEFLQILHDLEKEGLIRRQGRARSRDETFTITEKGLKSIMHILENLPQDLLYKMRMKRVGMDELGREGILHYLSVHYPGYEIKNVQSAEGGKGEG